MHLEVWILENRSLFLFYFIHRHICCCDWHGAGHPRATHTAWCTVSISKWLWRRHSQIPFQTLLHAFLTNCSLTNTKLHYDNDSWTTKIPLKAIHHTKQYKGFYFWSFNTYYKIMPYSVSYHFNNIIITFSIKYNWNTFMCSKCFSNSAVLRSIKILITKQAYTYDKHITR